MKKFLLYILTNILIIIIFYTITIKTLKISNIQVAGQGQLITLEIFGQQLDYYCEY